MLIEQIPKRFIGLDIHRKYFVAAGVDSKLNPVLGPHEAPMRQIEKWAKKTLTPADAVVVEMTTNTYTVYDALKPLVHSVTVVHPPHVALIVRAQVKTDKKAAFTLAQLHAAGLLPAVWIPPIEVREIRALVRKRIRHDKRIGGGIGARGCVREGVCDYRCVSGRTSCGWCCCAGRC